MKADGTYIDPSEKEVAVHMVKNYKKLCILASVIIVLLMLLVAVVAYFLFKPAVCTDMQIRL